MVRLVLLVGGILLLFGLLLLSMPMGNDLSIFADATLRFLGAASIVLGTLASGIAGVSWWKERKTRRLTRGCSRRPHRETPRPW